ncbi:hypothetical protein K1719_047155 [Acacia pycnantha]|nr:hypothetical protein K1719_047155 [Acacia pycnantha]
MFFCFSHLAEPQFIYFFLFSSFFDGAFLFAVPLISSPLSVVVRECGSGLGSGLLIRHFNRKKLHESLICLFSCSVFGFGQSAETTHIGQTNRPLTSRGEAQSICMNHPLLKDVQNTIKRGEKEVYLRSIPKFHICHWCRNERKTMGNQIFIVINLGKKVHYHINIEHLNGQLDDLNRERSSLQHRIDEDKNNVEQIEEKVIHWLGEVDDLSSKYKSFMKNESSKNRVQHNFMSRLWLCYKLSKREKTIAQGAIKIYGKRNFDRVSYRVPP